MAVLSNSRKKDIIRKEVDDKLHSKITFAEKKFGDELEKLVKKTVPCWFTDDVKKTQMVNTTSAVLVSGMSKDPAYNNYDRGARFSCYNAYPAKNYDRIKIAASKSLITTRKTVLDLKKEKSLFEKKLRTVLHSINTDKKLEMHLPELKKYVKTTSTALIPIAEIKEVRKMLTTK
jgi:hypothetical protein